MLDAESFDLFNSQTVKQLCNLLYRCILRRGVAAESNFFLIKQYFVVNKQNLKIYQFKECEKLHFFIFYKYFLPCLDTINFR